MDAEEEAQLAAAMIASRLSFEVEKQNKSRKREPAARNPIPGAAASGAAAGGTSIGASTGIGGTRRSMSIGFSVIGRDGLGGSFSSLGEQQQHQQQHQQPAGSRDDGDSSLVKTKRQLKAARKKVRAEAAAAEAEAAEDAIAAEAAAADAAADVEDAAAGGATDRSTFHRPLHSPTTFQAPSLIICHVLSLTTNH